MSGLSPTPRQRDVLVAIDHHSRRAGYAPTITELMAALEVTSSNGVVEHLRALAAKGLVTWERRRARTLSLTKSGRAFLPAALAAMLTLAGCIGNSATPSQIGCVDYCARKGMAVGGFYEGAAYGTGCICIIEKPLDVTCGAAWSRADAALDLLADCQTTLQACIDRTRGGGL